MSAWSIVFATPTLAQDVHGGDVVVTVAGNKIVTGLRDDHGETNEFLAHRIFFAEFGELIPNETDEPGFVAGPGTFATGSSVRFDLLDSLRRWDGSDFDAIPDERMGIRFGSTLGPIETPGTPSIVPGFPLKVADDGSWHRHFDFHLGEPAADGLYLLQLSLRNSEIAIGESKPFYIVFNQNQSQEQAQAAIDYVTSKLVDLPGDCNGDGAISAADLDCACSQLGEVLAATKLQRGDLDADQVVGFSDFLRLSARFGLPGSYREGDLDCNGTVEFSDFLIMSTNFGMGASRADLGNLVVVPEPQEFASGLALLASSFVLVRKRSYRWPRG